MVLRCRHFGATWITTGSDWSDGASGGSSIHWLMASSGSMPSLTGGTEGSLLLSVRRWVSRDPQAERRVWRDPEAIEEEPVETLWRRVLRFLAGLAISEEDADVLFWVMNVRVRTSQMRQWSSSSTWNLKSTFGNRSIRSSSNICTNALKLVLPALIFQFKILKKL